MSDLALAPVVDAALLAASADISRSGESGAADPFSALIGAKVEQPIGAEDPGAGPSAGGKDPVAMPASDATAMPAGAPPFAALARGAPIANVTLAAALAGAAMGMASGAPAATKTGTGNGAGPGPPPNSTLQAGAAWGGSAAPQLLAGTVGFARNGGAEPVGRQSSAPVVNAGARADASAGEGGMSASQPPSAFRAAADTVGNGGGAPNPTRGGAALRALSAGATAGGLVPAAHPTPPTPRGALGAGAQGAEPMRGGGAGHPASTTVASPVTVAGDGGTRDGNGARAPNANARATSGASVRSSAPTPPLAAASMAGPAAGTMGASVPASTDTPLHQSRGTAGAAPDSRRDDGRPANADRPEGAGASPALLGPGMADPLRDLGSAANADRSAEGAGAGPAPPSSRMSDPGRDAGEPANGGRPAEGAGARAATPSLAMPDPRRDEGRPTNADRLAQGANARAAPLSLGAPGPQRDAGRPTNADRPADDAGARAAPLPLATPAPRRADDGAEHASGGSRQPELPSDGAPIPPGGVRAGANLTGREAAFAEHPDRVIAGADNSARPTSTAVEGVPENARLMVLPLHGRDGSAEQLQQLRREGEPRDPSGAGTKGHERPATRPLPIQAARRSADGAVRGVEGEPVARTVAASNGQPFGGDHRVHGDAGRDPAARDGAVIGTGARPDEVSGQREAGARARATGPESSLIVPAPIVPASIDPALMFQAPLLYASLLHEVGGEPAQLPHGVEDRDRLVAANDENGLATRPASDWIDQSACSSRTGMIGGLCGHVAPVEAADASMAPADPPAFGGGLPSAAVTWLATASLSHPPAEIDAMEARSPSPYEAQGPPRRAPDPPSPPASRARGSITDDRWATLPVEPLCRRDVTTPHSFVRVRNKS